MERIRLFALAVFVCAACVFAAGQSLDYTIVVMPDVQNESQYFPQVLASQTQWIVNNRLPLNIQAVVGLGDIVNNGSDNAQWTNADAAYRLLDQAQIPYLLTLGNHDYDNALPASRSAVGYNQWFGPMRYLADLWYGGNLNGSNENFYGVLPINGVNYLFLGLEYVPRDASVAWANQILAANQDKRVIIFTHSYLNYDNTRIDQCDTQDQNSDNYGDKLWSKLVSQYPNIEMILSGHITGGKGARRVDLGVNGNLVNQVFANYQTLPNGGNGYMRIMTFHPATDTIDVQTYSPYLNAYMTDDSNQFTLNWHTPATSATQGSITGIVRDAGTCKRIAGAQVSDGTNTATTDANGNYSLPEAAGNYNLTATVSGYGSGSQTANVNNGYGTESNFYLTAVAPTTCTMNPANPSVTICTPANAATVASPFPLTAGTTDTSTVSYVQLFVDGSPSTSQRGGILNTNVTLPDGAHRLTVQAKDAAGALFKSTINVTVSTTGPPPPPPPPPSCTINPTSPSVTICNPTDGSTVSTNLTVNAQATDNFTVSYIQLYVDGSAKVTQNGSKLTATTTLTPGTHRITVQAKDVNGTLFKSTVNVLASASQ